MTKIKYYDIEIFTEPIMKWYGKPYIIKRSPFWHEETVYDWLKEMYSANDSYFINSMFRHKDDLIDPSHFASLLKAFYFYYPGDAIGWLEHTMNIVYVYNDMWLDNWIKNEREGAEPGKLTVYQYLMQFKDELKNRTGSKKEVMLKITEQSNGRFRYSYLDRIRKEMDFDLK